MTMQKNKSIGFSRKILHPFTVKDIVKDTEEQPDEEIRRMEYRRVLGPGASVPKDSRWPHPPGTWMHSPKPEPPPLAILQLNCLGFFVVKL